jgi:thiosulfate dehydrogenase [quinone] large subunit
MANASRTPLQARAPHRPDTVRGPGRRAARPRTFAEGWVEMPWAIRVLRAFLGVTFLFAGIQKFLDPNFLRPGGGDYIGTQLTGFASGTPAAPLMRVLAEMPMLAGVGIALLEIAIGLGTLLGVAMLAAAIGGFAVNVTLWLSATWHTHPYFLGSDSIYAVAWLALALAIVEIDREREGHVAGPIERIDGVSRREFTRGGLVAGTAVLLGIFAKAFAAPATSTGLGGLAGPTTRTPDGGASRPPSSAPPATPAAQGRVLTTLDRLPVGGAAGFTDPQVGPAALVRLSTDQVVAYGRTCTHAGCLVGYDQSARMLVCPCHGAEFDPARHAEPVAGPAPTPLPSIHVVVDQATGDVVLPN